MYTKVKIIDTVDQTISYMTYKQLRPMTELEQKEWFAQHVILPLILFALTITLVIPAIERIF